MGAAAGKTPGGPGGGKKEDESTKIEFINLVDPLIQTMKNSNFNLASLSASALVNLCNYSEDIKDIFLQQNGLNAILEYMTCKEEDTLLNILRLLLALIANSEPIGKLICEENDNEAIYSLLNILKGPSIPNTRFSIKITFFALTIMRALIRHSMTPKMLFVRDHAALDSILSHIKPDAGKGAPINEQTEVCIYSFFLQVIREEAEYKRIIGKKLIPLCSKRLAKAAEIPFTSSACEAKFFKMLGVLIKKCKDNIYLVRGGMKDRLQQYKNSLAKDPKLKKKIGMIITAVDEFEE